MSERDSSLEGRARKTGLIAFVGIVLGLAGLSVALAFLPVPPRLVPIVYLLVGAVFIAAPVFALFRAADHPWRPWLAVVFIGVGVSAHVGLAYAAAILGPRGVWPATLSSLAQTGLMTWCAGLGALLATLLKEKNMLIPVAIFLAAFDVFTLLTPAGPTQAIMRAQPQIFESVSWTVPKVQEVPTFGPVAATARIGPADFLFMAMFFVALYRFQMRVRATYLWLAPTLVAYMVFVFVAGPLPALVPIGICVLIVNWREFRLTAQEWGATALVAALGLGLIAWGMTRPKPPPEPSPPAPVPGFLGSAGSPSPAIPN